MSLVINRLVIEVNTDDGPYGLDISFSRGLFILRVENTHGKSTCMNAIAYALGMEMALGQQSAKPPFPPSLVKSIQDERGVERLVISSRVKLEISNSSGDTVTLKRNVVGADADTIITLHDAPVDEARGDGRSLFLHGEGDTSRDMGFYYWMAQFIGWSLPLVPNNRGGESPLYPAILFPLFFVEQKKGWSAIQATTPLHFQIPNARRRAFEFVMDLDVNEVVKRKAANKKLIEAVIEDWKDYFSQFANVAVKVDGKVFGVDRVPNAKFEAYKLDILVNEQDKWRSLPDAMECVKEKLFDLESEEVSKVKAPDDSEDRKKIRHFKEKIRSFESEYESNQDEIAYLLNQIDATSYRVNSLIDDKRKYEDLRKIKEFKTLRDLPVLDNKCPTCGQEYSDHSAYIECSDDLMTLDESLNFIKSQITTFKSVLQSYQSQYEFKSIEQAKLDQEIERCVAEVSRISERLYSEFAGIDEDALREKIRLEFVIKSYEEALENLANFRNKFHALSGKYRELMRLKRKLPEHGFSAEDSKKLTRLEKLVVGFLERFGFSSFDPELLSVSRDTYLPTREGFDLGFDVSASDGIRVIWSYLISLFSISSEFKTNHAGILIFDEPRQQEANKVSFAGLLKGASSAAGLGQIIFATSEEEDVLEKALAGSQYKMLSFSPSEGKILRKLPSQKG